MPDPVKLNRNFKIVHVYGNTNIDFGVISTWQDPKPTKPGCIYIWGVHDPVNDIDQLQYPPVYI